MSDAHQFSIHYTVDEARALLPEIKQWLAGLNRLEGRLQESVRKVEELMAGGQDRGGPVVETYLELQTEVMSLLNEFQKRQILIKDIQRGLIDFPAFIADREVFLCWEQGEEDIEFWHDIDAGYAGRERL